MATSIASAAFRSSARKSSRDAVARALALYGTPYKHAGRSRSGVDCFGLVLHAFELDETQDALYGELRAIAGAYYDTRKWWKNREGAGKSREALFRYISKHFEQVEALQPGDLVALTFKSRTGEADHLAIYIGDEMIVHSDMREGVTLVALREVQKRIVGVYRIKD